jgi:hypothetical protein
MPIKKGLKTLVENTPDFSNQALENAVNELKIGWVAKTFTLDTAITNNNVLTTTQKNDARATINNQPHLNVGRYLNDMLAHTNTILDGTIVFLNNPDTEDTADFLEILQTVQGIQSLIPELYGVPASEKSRDVNDHFGTLNNKFLNTEDSSKPVFTSLKETIEYLTGQSIATDTAYQTALTNMTNFVDGVVGDSTDFQQTLNTFASAVATAATNFHNGLASEPLLTKRNLLIADREEINTQVALENSNLVGIRTYVETLTNNISYTSLAEDKDLREFMSNISQNLNWKSYFDNYDAAIQDLNPIYEGANDSAKTVAVDQVLASRGLPDVTDHLDFTAVANKAKQDPRIDTKFFDSYTIEKQITKSCEQLGITTAGRTIANQSRSLLNNMNENDRAKVIAELDSNQSADTIS